MSNAFTEPRYQPAEVGRLLGVKANTVRRWLGSLAEMFVVVTVGRFALR